MDEKKLFLNDDIACGDDCMELSLDDASLEELDQLWDDADDEFEAYASKKECNQKKCIIGAIIAAAVIAVLGFVLYKCIKSSRDN